MNLNYTLEGKQPVPCNDLTQWALWFESADRRVRLDTIHGIRVSTVFLGLDHGWGQSASLLFETMLFSEVETDLTLSNNLGMLRYSTWEEAEAGHQRVVSLLHKSLPKQD